MNYNPYLYNNFFPYQNTNINQLAKRGIFSSLLGGTKSVNWGNILNNTQKTLNVINQAIPVYYQVKPIYNNAKTMLKMVHALKDDDTNKISHTNENKKDTSTGPVFFL